jgi:prolyl-tRNA synthetase
MDETGSQKPVYMGCYGIGPSRVMGSVVESHHDERGIIWPKAVAPFHAHLVSLSSKDEDGQERIRTASEDAYESLCEAGIEVLWDDRDGMTAGSKFADADLLGLPLRIVVSEKTLAENSVEWKLRASDEPHLVPLDDIAEEVG